MKTKITWLAVTLIALSGIAAAQQKPAPQPKPPEQHQHDQMAGMDMGSSKQAESGAVQSMSHHQHAGPHMHMTDLRATVQGDQARADELVKTLRGAIEKYKDYHVALAEGFQIFLPNFPQPEFHFTNYRYGFLAALAFDPSRPTSLLYRKTARGYELVGAMYTMPRNATEAELNQRVPLSVARWHLHTNLCAPPKGQAARADWTKFGLQGSIATQEACEQAGGQFHPVVFGWMVHVYPFEDSPDKIWAH
jgi:hypothetical protein